MEKLEKANTPLEQIYKNTENIYKLSQYVKPLYNAKINLGAAADVVDVSDTNLTEGVEKALIMDINGNVYNFVSFNEDKTKAYIEYYATIQGAQGPQGPEGPEGPEGPSGADSIDDTTTAANKLWSSQKTNNEITQIKGIGVIYSTAATPTQDNDEYIFNKTDFITEPLPNWTAIIGKQICQIVDSKIKYIYSVVAANTTTITCVLIGEVGGGGSTLYQHNIQIYGKLAIDNSQVYACVHIINNSPLPFVAHSDYIEGQNQDLHTYFTSKGYYCTELKNAYANVAIWNSNTCMCIGAYYDSGTYYLRTIKGNNQLPQGFSSSNLTITDSNPQPL